MTQRAKTPSWAEDTWRPGKTTKGYIQYVIIKQTEIPKLFCIHMYGIHVIPFQLFWNFDV